MVTQKMCVIVVFGKILKVKWKFLASVSFFHTNELNSSSSIYLYSVATVEPPETLFSTFPLTLYRDCINSESPCILYNC